MRYIEAVVRHTVHLKCGLTLIAPRQEERTRREIAREFHPHPPLVEEFSPMVRAAQEPARPPAGLRQRQVARHGRRRLSMERRDGLPNECLQPLHRREDARWDKLQEWIRGEHGGRTPFQEGDLEPGAGKFLDASSMTSTQSRPPPS